MLRSRPEGRCRIHAQRDRCGHSPESPTAGTVRRASRVRDHDGASCRRGGHHRMQERAKATASRSRSPPARRRARTCARRRGPEGGASPYSAGASSGPRSWASSPPSGIGEVSVYRRLRWPSSPRRRAEERGLHAREGRDLRPNRYTLTACSCALGCEVSTWRGARRPRRPSSAPSPRPRRTRTCHHSGAFGGRGRLREGDPRQARRGLFWKIAMKPAGPLAYGKIGRAHFLRPARKPGSVMVTFYQFVRAPCWSSWGRIRGSPSPRSRPHAQRLKKAPGTHGVPARILSRAADGSSGEAHREQARGSSSP
jgi:molybdopterin molybdotransferase